MKTLVLLRHGESAWNLENRFTGWTDVDLTPKGIREAHEAARLLGEGGYTFDLCFTSVLKRDPDALDRPGRHGPHVADREPELAPQRTALRRPPGPQQGGDHGPVR